MKWNPESIIRDLEIATGKSIVYDKSYVRTDRISWPIIVSPKVKVIDEYTDYVIIRAFSLIESVGEGTDIHGVQLSTRFNRSGINQETDIKVVNLYKTCRRYFKSKGLIVTNNANDYF